MKNFLKKVGLFTLIIIGINQVVIFFYEKPLRQSIANNTNMRSIKWNDVRNPTNKYDIIILGSSRGYSAYNPLILDSILKKNSYNMCTGSQDIIESYYILKDILKSQKPRHIIYDIFLPSFKDNTDFYLVFANARFMTNSGKYNMLFKGYGIESVVNLLMPIIRDRTYLQIDLLNFIPNKIRSKKGKEIQKKENWIKGYYYDNHVVDSASIRNFTEVFNFTNTKVSEKKVDKYFTKLIELCNKNDIKLVCVRAPYPPSRWKINPSDTVKNYFNAVCKNKNVQFYDFNYIDDSRFKYYDADFSDYHHLNYLGANKSSVQLSGLLLMNE